MNGGTRLKRADSSKRRLKTAAGETGKPLARDLHDFTHRLFPGAHRGMLRTEFFQYVVSLVSGFSGCSEVELWVIEREKIFHAVHCLTSLPLFRLEVMPIHEEEPPENPLPVISSLREICISLMRREEEPPASVFQKRGSLYLSRRGEPFNDTVMLLPIRADGVLAGNMVIACPGAAWCADDELPIYEEMAFSVGVALAHRRAQVHLRERVKELTCLYGIARIFADHDTTPSQMLQKVARALPSAWLYPDIARAAIVLDHRQYGASPDETRVDLLRAPLLPAGVKRGEVEVFYTEKRPELDEGPFLFEERHLVETVAHEIEVVLERFGVEEERLKVQEQLRHADRLATIGQLAAGVAHEINEPLAAILGFAQLAQQNEGIPPAAARDLDKIIRSSLHARDIVKNLLLFSRQTPPQKTGVLLNDVVQEAIQLCGSRSARMGIEVLLHCDPALPPLIADRGQLHQVLINLVVNALQAMEGGGELTISTALVEDEILLTVKDTGIGMSKDVLARIFVPFFTTKDVNEGTGLGLAVVHGIVTAHGGRIEVESIPCGGSVFTIHLPLDGGGKEERW
jgi:signal transduction histidine kinase